MRHASKGDSNALVASDLRAISVLEKSSGRVCGVAIGTDGAENIMHIAQMHCYCVGGRCIEAKCLSVHLKATSSVPHSPFNPVASSVVPIPNRQHVTWR